MKTLNLARVCGLVIVGLLAVMPIWFFVTVWTDSLGSYEIWRSLPSVVIFTIFVVVFLGMLIKDRAMARRFFIDKLNLLILILCVVIFTSLWLGEATWRAKLAGAAMDGRFLLAFLSVRILAVRDPLFWKRVFAVAPKFLAITGVVLALIGLVQITLLPRDFLANFGYHLGGVAPYVTIDHGETLRAFATLAGPNNYANYLLITLFAAIFLIKKQPRKLGWWLALVAIIAGLTASSSRGAWLATAVALITYFLLSRKLSRKVIAHGAVGLILLAIVSLLLFQLPAVRENILHIRNGRDASIETSNDGHIDGFTSGVDQIVKQPLGCGVGCAGPASHYSKVGIISENYYLQLAQEYSVLGAVIFVAILWLILTGLRRAPKNSFAQVWLTAGIGLVVAALFAHTFTDEAVAVTWFAIAGGLLNEIKISKVYGRQPKPLRPK